MKQEQVTEPTVDNINVGNDGNAAYGAEKR